MDTSFVQDYLTESSSTIAESGIFSAYMHSFIESFKGHPFIWLGIITIIFCAAILVFKWGNDWQEGVMQDFAHKGWIFGMVCIFMLGLLFAIDAGLITLQMVTGVFN